MPTATEIANLILQGGNAQAQAIANKGRIWGGAVAGLGDLASQSYQQGQQEKLQAQEAEVRAQQLAESRQRMGLEAEQGTREASAFEANQAAAARATTEQLHTRTVQRLGAVRGKPELWNATRASILADGLAKPEDIPTSYPGDDAIDGEMRGLLSVDKQWDEAHPKPVAVGSDSSLVDPVTHQVVFQGTPKAPAAKPMEQQLLEAEQAGNKPLAAQIRSVMNARDINMAPPDQSAVALSPAGLDAAAMMFAKTGQLPPMGMGKQAADARTKIINRAAVLMPGLDVASAKADFTANQDSLKTLQKQRDAIGAFEETALKNLDQFMGTAQKVIDTGSPLLNRPLRSFNDAVLGSPEMAAFNVARRTVVPEFAKILNNPTLSGQLSDSARKEVEDVVSGNATLPQIVAVAKVLKTDAANRRTSMDDQLAAIRGRISKATKPAETETPKAPPAPAGAPTYQDYLNSRKPK